MSLKIRWDLAAIISAITLFITGIIYVTSIHNKINELETSKADISRITEIQEKVNSRADKYLVGKIDGRLIAIEGDKDYKSIQSKKREAIIELDETLAEAINRLEKIGSKIKDDVVSYEIPTGTIAAFKLKQCPDGWVPFSEGEGRFIVGMGKGKGLIEKKFGDTGGAERVALTIEQLPSHLHRLPTEGHGSNTGNVYAVRAVGKANYDHHVRETSSTGENQSHENMPPYIVMRMCIKE